jgi:hypothetical protein
MRQTANMHDREGAGSVNRGRKGFRHVMLSKMTVFWRFNTLPAERRWQ